MNKQNPCATCDDNCSECSIYLGRNGIPMGYGGEAPRENHGQEDALLDQMYEDRSYCESDND